MAKIGIFGGIFACFRYIRIVCMKEILEGGLECSWELEKTFLGISRGEMLEILEACSRF